MGAVWAVVIARALARAASWLLVAVGVAVATAVPVLTSASTRVASAGALEHGLADLPAGRRSLTVSFNGFLAGEELAKFDQVVRSRLHTVSSVAPLRQVVFRRLSNGRHGEFTLGAVDGLGRAVRLTSGRAPASCTPQRCEVVQIGNQPTPDTTGLGLVVVGRVTRADPLLLSGTFDPGTDAPVLLGADTRQTAALAALEDFQRSWGWVVPVDVHLVTQVGVDRFLARESDLSDQLFRQDNGLILTAPDDVLRSEDDRARRSGRRFALLGGTSAVLVLGLAIVAAVSVRRDHLGVVRLLRTRGATPAQLAAFTAAESTWPVAVGALFGVGAAYVAALVAWGRPVASYGVTGGLGTALLVAGLSAVAVGFTLRWRPLTGERGAWRAVSIAAAATVAAAVLAASRGGTGVETGAPTDPLLSLLPVLTAVAGGLIAARFWPLAPRLIARLIPSRAAGSRAAGLRIALAGAARRPLRPTATVAVLSATCASVVFAGAYRATIDRGAADEAAYRVPMVARLTTGPTLIRAVDVAAGPALSSAAPGAVAYPVLRTTATVALTSAENASVELVGLDPAALPRMARWRPDYSAADPTTLSRRLATLTPRSGIAIPDGARMLTVPATGSTFQLDVIALVHDAPGRSLPITLARRGDVLVGDLPPATGRTLDALTLREDTAAASRRQHTTGEGGIDQPARTGRVTLGQPAAAGRTLPHDLSGWSVTAPGRGTPAAGRLVLDYRIAGDTTTAAPAGPPAAPISAYVDGATARLARAGVLSLDLGQGHRIAVHVVATGARFPTTRGRFAVVDRAALAQAVDAVTPGAGTPTEVWVWAPSGDHSRALEAAVRQEPYDRLAVESRAAIEHSLRTDPVAVTASRLLLGTAAAALLIGALCIVLLVGAERHESAGELFAREAEGSRPGTLRRALFARAAAVVAIGVPFGILTGLALARATTTLVAVTAAGTTPNPPLLLAAAPAAVTAELAALLVLALTGAAVVAAGSLRGQQPIMPDTDLR